MLNLQARKVFQIQISTDAVFLQGMSESAALVKN